MWRTHNLPHPLRPPPPAPPGTCQPTSPTRPQPLLPKGFVEQTMYSGCLNQPTGSSFHAAKPGVFVAEKAGKVVNCDLSATPKCTLVADLSSEVCSDSDRGILGLAVDPLDDTKVYVLYTTDPGCVGDVLTHGQL